MWRAALAGVGIGLLLGGSATIAITPQARKLESLEKGAPAPISKSWSEGRQAEIEKCREAGGLPVILAGVLASDGIGCAKPVGD
jgi:hypothetical protein